MRVERRRLSKVVVPGALLLILTTSFTAHASTVTVTGGFLSFSGVSAGTAAGCDRSFQGIVAGAIVNAPSCTGPAGIWGPASYVFPSTLGSFEFYEKQFGSDLAHNRLSFVPAGAQTVEIGEYFLLGTLSFTNGIWFGIARENRFQFQLTTVSADPLLNGHSFSTDVTWAITPNMASNTPAQNADYLFLNSFVVIGALWAYEAADSPTGTNTVSASLLGRIGSLTPTGFADVTGGFSTASVPGEPSAVPEPMSLILVGTGIAATLRSSRRKR